MILKSKDTNSININKVLEENEELNKYIEEEVNDVDKWIIYANDNYFSKENRPLSYKGITIHYNDFIMTDTIIICERKVRV